MKISVRLSGPSKHAVIREVPEEKCHNCATSQSLLELIENYDIYETFSQKWLLH